MKILAVFVTLGFALLLVGVVLAGAGSPAGASSPSLQETDLAPNGEASEVNLGSDGFLYISDLTAKRIWRLDPASLSVKQYQLAYNVLDARPDNAGNVWFTDGGPTFARLNQVSNTVVYWDVPIMHNLQGLAFDSSGKVWMTEFINFYSKIYSYEIASTELCTYTLPLDGSRDGSSQSFYILSHQDTLWIANRGEQKIYRLDPTLNQATWWQIPDSASRPVGIAFDGQGNLWWADDGLGALARLEPATDVMTRFNLPNTTRPKMILPFGGVVWYTAVVKGSPGYLGVLDPLLASGSTRDLISHTYPASRHCNLWGAGTPTYVSATPQTPSWSPVSLSLKVNTSAWLVYQLPTGANPYGLAIENGNIWITDRLIDGQGRQKLMRLPISAIAKKKIFLPLVLR